MSAATDYIRDLSKSRLVSTELECFLAHVAAETEKDERQRAIDYLLRVVDLTPDQVKLLYASGPVRSSGGLQLSVKRYATTKQFEAAQISTSKESEWKILLYGLGSIFPPW